MINFVQLQTDVTQALLCAGSLANISIAQYRKLRLQSQIDWSVIWTTPRNSKSGCGILVEMPTFQVKHPNLPGPERELVLTFAVIEEPNLNMEPTGGTLLSAEEVSESILDLLHGFLIEGVGGLYAEPNAIQPAEEFQGLVAYRVSLRMRSPRQQTVRVATPNINEANLNVTFTCDTPGAVIWYTQDGSFPGPANPAAALYSVQFHFIGTVLRWAGYHAGLIQSHVAQVINQG